MRRLNIHMSIVNIVWLMTYSATLFICYWSFAPFDFEIQSQKGHNSNNKVWISVLSDFA